MLSLLPGHLPQPPQGPLPPHRVRVQVPPPNKSPPWLPSARVASKLLDWATPVPLELAPHSTPGDPALELPQRDSFWLSPGPSHLLFPWPETLLPLSSLFGKLFILLGLLLQEVCLDALD